MEQVVDISGNRFWLLCIPGDGNCLFGSVVHQLYGVTPTHQLFSSYKRQLREAAVQEIWDHIEEYHDQLIIYAEDTIKEDVPAGIKVRRYLNELRTEGVWAGAECIAAICNRHQIAITVYQDNCRIDFTPTRSESAECATYKIFYRGVVNGVRTHYDSVLCIRPQSLPTTPIGNFEQNDITLYNDTISVTIVHIGDESSSIFTALHHQLTRTIPTDEELNLYRGLIASEIEKQSDDFLVSFGMASGSGFDMESFLFRLRIGRHDGGFITLSLMSSLFRFEIYIHSAVKNTVRLEPMGIGRSTKIHLLEEEQGDRKTFSSIVSLKHLRSSIRSPKRSSMQDAMTVATIAARNEQTSSQVTIATDIVISRQGLRLASLNVNGCRTKKKREDIDEFLMAQRVHVAVLQEVNLDCQQLITTNYRWYMGATSGTRKRGLATLIRQGLNAELQASRGYGPNIQYSKLVYQVGLLST